VRARRLPSSEVSVIDEIKVVVASHGLASLVLWNGFPKMVFPPHETWEFLEIATWTIRVMSLFDLNKIGLCFEKHFWRLI